MSTSVRIGLFVLVLVVLLNWRMLGGLFTVALILGATIASLRWMLRRSRSQRALLTPTSARIGIAALLLSVFINWHLVRDVVLGAFYLVAIVASVLWLRNSHPRGRRKSRKPLSPTIPEKPIAEVPAHPIAKMILHSKFGAPQIRAASGHMVRSHSERLIAETLHKSGVRFEYETPLEADGARYFPDFTIKIGERTYYLEHFGMLDDEEYSDKTTRKTAWYDRNFPGQLISCSADYKEIPAHIHRIIQVIHPRH